MNILDRPNKKKRRIAAIGMYDGVHLGHRFLIDYLTLEARARGLVPSVVTFIDHPLAVVSPEKSPALLTSREERQELLDRAGVEDCIMLTFDDRMHHTTAARFVANLHENYAIDAIVVGFNTRFGHDRVEGIDRFRNIGASIGVDIIEAPEYRGAGAPVSSSIIRDHIGAGRLDKAAEALGRPYSIRGRVVEGKRLGRTIGYPTANISLTDSRRLLPPEGVYAVYATTPDGVRRPAVVNIGFRPTVEHPIDQPALSVEVHIPDFTGYLYDEELTIEFISRLRDEKKFASLEKLRRQLADDIEKARKILSK